MWCVVHVRDREERRVEEFIAGLLPKNINAQCFHLTRSRKKRFEGRWQTIQEELFPGYVFIDTDDPDRIYRELKKAPRLKLLFSDDEYVSTLEQNESDFIELIADKNGDIGISRVMVDEDGTIRYLSGPLHSVRDKVRKVNLHKRIAEVETSLMGRKQLLYLGIEIGREADLEI